MSTDELKKEIENIFPLMPMPSGNQLPFHKDGCFQCEYLKEDIEEYRNKEITGDLIRAAHQEMSCLSAIGWKWLLPYYLRYCLTEEAEHTRMETEFLIYNLGPNPEFQEETIERLSLLNNVQVKCLIHFLKWCESSPYWSDFYAEDISKAILFLSTFRHNMPFDSAEQARRST